MTSKTLQLQFPMRGVVRRASLAATAGAQGPYPTPWATNARLEDALTNRLRGGSFTGISAASRPESIIYRDRTLTFSGRVITASRVGDSSDTTMSADVSDMLRPALFQFSEAAEQGGTVVALVPHKDQTMLGFTATETWVQNGDPLSGSRHRVSDQVGIVGPNAWCVAHDTVYFLSSHGLYSVGTDGSGLKALSEDAIPEDLTGVEDAACTLTYQHSDRGVYIHKTGTDWFVDVGRGGFWPFDTSTTQSHVLFGPFHLGNHEANGRVLHIHGTVAQGSAAVTWALIPGTSTEEAAANGKLAVEAAIAGNSYSSYVSGTGSWTAGKNHRAYPRTRAMAVALWLRSSGTWAYESSAMTIIDSGMWR